MRPDSLSLYATSSCLLESKIRRTETQSEITMQLVKLIKAQPCLSCQSDLFKSNYFDVILLFSKQFGLFWLLTFCRATELN